VDVTSKNLKYNLKFSILFRRIYLAFVAV